MIAKSRKYKKSSWKTILSSFVLSLLVIGLIAFFVYSNWNIGRQRKKFQAEIDSLTKEIEIYENKIAQLKSGIDYTASKEYQTEKLYKEGYVEKGAAQVVVLGPKENEKTEKENSFSENNSWNPKNWWINFQERIKDLREKIKWK